MKKIFSIISIALLFLAGCSYNSNSTTVTSMLPTASVPAITPSTSVFQTETPKESPIESPIVTPTLSVTQAPTKVILNGSGKIGDYYITIEKMTFIKSSMVGYGVYVYYKWKNGSDQAKVFCQAVRSEVAQNGVECYISTPPLNAKIDLSASGQKVNSGEEQEVVVYYHVYNLKSPIIVSITGLSDAGDTTIESEFQLK